LILQPLLDVLKQTMHPSSVFACLLLMFVGVLLLYLRSAERWGKRWLVAVMAGYWIISTPVGSRLLVRGLGNYGAVARASEVPGDTVIVVLGGGASTYHANGLTVSVPSDATAFRVLEAARLYRLLGDPLIIASGGVVFPAGDPTPESDVVGKGLMDLGVPPQRIVSESRSRNTIEQAAALKAILLARHINHFVLVTSRMHMKRSLAVFRAAGLAPYPSAAPLRSDGLPDRPAWLPDEGYLRVSGEAIYDYLALGYYWARGRL
jgi:uncharacterized SAM-binding protein YcdF (DUF218 family)